MHVPCKSNLVSERLSFLLLYCNRILQAVFRVGLLQPVEAVPMYRICKFSCRLISSYIDDEELVNLRASNIIGKLRWGVSPQPSQYGNSELSIQSWNVSICLPNKS